MENLLLFLHKFYPPIALKISAGENFYIDSRNIEIFKYNHYYKISKYILFWKYNKN